VAKHCRGTCHAFPYRIPRRLFHHRCAVLGGLFIFAALSSNKPAAAPSPPPDLGQVQASQAAIAAFEAKERALIKRGELDIRGVWLADWAGRPIGNPEGSIVGAKLHAVVRNKAALATLTKLGFTVDLFDCPAYAVSTSVECDQIGSFKAQATAAVPPNQVRDLMDRSLPDIDHLPPLHGTLQLRYTVDYICGNDGTLAPYTLYSSGDLVCQIP
jgi:hypothetical protein